MSTVASALSIKGERRTGQDVRTQNVMAASSIANIVKVSMACLMLIELTNFAPNYYKYST